MLKFNVYTKHKFRRLLSAPLECYSIAWDRL